jgi:hypothetical protein
MLATVIQMMRSVLDRAGREKPSDDRALPLVEDRARDLPLSLGESSVAESQDASDRYCRAMAARGPRATSRLAEASYGSDSGWPLLGFSILGAE